MYSYTFQDYRWSIVLARSLHNFSFLVQVDTSRRESSRRPALLYIFQRDMMYMILQYCCHNQHGPLVSQVYTVDYMSSISHSNDRYKSPLDTFDTSHKIHSWPLVSPCLLDMVDTNDKPKIVRSHSTNDHSRPDTAQFRCCTSDNGLFDHHHSHRGILQGLGNEYN